MSAFIVSELHIDLILRVAVEGPDLPHGGHWHGPLNGWREELPETLTEMGAALMAENQVSYNYRYPHEPEGPIPYKYTRPPRLLTTVEAIKAVQCYEYQACEHGLAWEQSRAARFCRDLMGALIAVLPGYNDAPWGNY